MYIRVYMYIRVMDTRVLLMIRSFICIVIPMMLILLYPTTCSYYLLLIFYISLLAGPSLIFRYQGFINNYIIYIQCIPMMLILCLLLPLATNPLHFLTLRSQCSVQVY